MLAFYCTLSVFADGTKQLMPKDSKGVCYIALGSREGGNGLSREFARYNHSDKKSCDKLNRLYFQIKEAGEIVYLGFGGLHYNGSLYVHNTTKVNNFLVGTFAKYRIMTDAGSIAKAEADIPTSNTEAGYIENDDNGYQSVCIGPNTLVGGEGGYNPIVVSGLAKGLYYLEFDIGCDFGKAEGCPLDFEKFDITIADKDNHAINGRVYSMAWGLNADGSENQVWSTFYTLSTDGYVSKVYFSGIKPYRFVFGCNSYGALNDAEKTAEERRQSQPGINSFTPEYKIFLTPPDKDLFTYSQGPKAIENLTFAGDAITCEDLLFVVKLLGTESVTLELFMDLNSDEQTDKVLIERLEPIKNKERGYHYPWKNNPELKKAGKYYYSPVAEGCPREYKLSLFDQRFKLGANVYNVGDTLKGDYHTEADIPEPSWTTSSTDGYPVEVGTENNPILITSKQQLEDMATALRGETTPNASYGNNSGYMFYYTIDNFLYESDAPYKPISKTFAFSAENGFEGKYFYIVAPTGTIKLDANWLGLGTETHPFKGNIGAGRYNPNPLTDNTDENYSNKAGDQCAITFGSAKHGLFNYCEGATIDNIHIEGSFETETKEYCGITSNIESDKGFGAICSYAKNSDFRYCVNNATIDFDVSVDINSLENNDADIVYDGCTGGIVGYATGGKISGCSNYSNIKIGDYSDVESTISANGMFVEIGGIVGGINGVTIDSCFNNGYIYSDMDVGGIVGVCNGSSTITRCRNEGTIEAESIGAGGIVGNTNTAITISRCYNCGYISSFMYSSGIIGEIISNLVNSTDIDLSYCVNLGNTSKNIFSPSENFNYPAYSFPTEDEQSQTEFVNANSNEFYIDGNGNVGLLETMCVGRTWRNEDAGRLYCDDNTYYIAWDGKYDNGDCVTGKITVNYRKASGVTHFPFYDPEKIETTNGVDNILKGLVVYRVSPIMDDEVSSCKPLPKGYYQNNVVSEDEKGFELKLYWDDRKISYGSACTMAQQSGFVYGETVVTPAEYELVETSYWKEWTGTCNKRVSIKDGDGQYVYVCKTLARNATGIKHFFKKTLVTSEKTVCNGIENVNFGGYYGSEAGGHAFPINLFGDKNTMNTWWNGVEVKKELALELNENSPAVLLPIEIASWIVQNETNSVLLEWSTSSEVNNETFQIERSFDGIHWGKIGAVLGAGTTSSMHYYSFVDEEPLDGISYYRLKQVDFNGGHSYSSIKTINRKTSLQKDSFKAYTKENENAFVVEGEQIAACPISVYDTFGRLIPVSYNTISTNKVVIYVGDIEAGPYIIRSCNTAKTVVKRW